MEKNAMVTDNEEGISDLMTDKIDEITGGEMKKVGVQKMENELTIKKLDREYLEVKRNMFYSKKMLDEARKNGSAQTETKNQLLQANKAIIEKFNELKKYQNEITLMNISKAENSLEDCIDRNNQCSRILQIITEKDHYFASIKDNLLDKENQLNDDIRRQIEQTKESVNNRESQLLLLTQNVDSQKVQIDEEKNDKRVKHAVEERNKRVIQLQADVEALGKQFKQEINDLQQKKFDKTQSLENYENDIKTREDRLRDLQSQLLEAEKILIERNKNLEDIKKKNNEISCDIQKKRETTYQSHGSFENNITSIHSELVLVDSELQKEQMGFNEAENKMQHEMERLFKELEQKKKQQKELENRQRDLSRVKENRIDQQKDLSQNRELDVELRNLTEEYNKQILIGPINTTKQIGLNNRIKDLREKRDNSRKQLENLNKIQSETRKAINANDNVAKNSADIIKPSPQINVQKRSYESYRKDSEFENNVPSSQIPKKTPQYSNNLDKLTSGFSSSDESEDELNINEILQKSTVLTATLIYKNQDYTRGFSDKYEKDAANKPLSQSERLFDELMSSQKPPESTFHKEEDVFKIPATYTPVKKRTPQSRKY